MGNEKLHLPMFVKLLGFFLCSGARILILLIQNFQSLWFSVTLIYY